MFARSFQTGLSLLVAGVVLGGQARTSRAQDIVPPTAPAPAVADDLPAVPRGVEVLTRGPIHEAFASLTTEAAPTAYVAKQPPKAIDEMPPEEKPDGDVQWIGGYWAWDDDHDNFLWVSGTWRIAPPGKQWVAGYWREDGGKYQWVAGFWQTAAKAEELQKVTYQPAPPPAPQVAPPAEKPNPESFLVPGHWVWEGNGYAWKSAYWAKVEPGYVWVAAHYRWTPSGYIYIPGYWDYAVSRRGMLYAPVIIDTNVVGATYVYTPAYAVHETVVVDALWVRPSHCHYYFGDYYGEEYHTRGFESCVVYSRGHYDSIVVYETYEHRREPEWINIQINTCRDRHEHRESRPPRTLVEQTRVVNKTTIINNTTVVNKTVVVAPAARVAAAHGSKTVVVDNETRGQVKQQAVAVQQVGTQRGKAELAAPGGAPKQPVVAALNVPKQQPIAPKPVAAAPIAGAHMPNVGGTPTNPTTHPAVTTPPITQAGAHAPTTTVPPTHPVTTPPTAGTPAPGTTHPATLPPPPPPGPNTTKPSTTPGQPGSMTNPHPGQQPVRPGDPPAGRKPPPKDKDKDSKDKDKNQ